MGFEHNHVTLMGNLTRDPELRYVTSGSAVCSFTVAVNRTYYDANKEKKQECSFITVTTWGKLAERVGEYGAKGSPVFVEGSLKQETWEVEGKEKREKTGVTARVVTFLSMKPRQEESSQVRREEVETIDVDKDADEKVPF